MVEKEYILIKKKRGRLMQTVYWLILFVMLVIKDLYNGAYNHLVCRRSLVAFVTGILGLARW